MKLLTKLKWQESRIDNIKGTIKMDILKKACRDFKDMGAIQVEYEEASYPTIHFTLKDGRKISYEINVNKWSNGHYATMCGKFQFDLKVDEIASLTSRVNIMMEAK